MHWPGQGASLAPESLENRAFQAKSVILVKIEDGFHVGFGLVRIPGKPGLLAQNVVPAFTIEVPSGGGQVLLRPSVTALLRPPLNVDPCVEDGRDSADRLVSTRDHRDDMCP